MKISDIRDAALFQRLVHRLQVAERGVGVQIPDDSGGDRGNDGYDPTRRILYAIYCPEKPDTADMRRKARSDLAKAIGLKKQAGYDIENWVFVTPTALREPLQAELRAEAASGGLSATFMSAVHLEDLYRRHPHLRSEFPELEYPNVEAQLEAIRSAMEQTRDTARPMDESVAEAAPQRPVAEIPALYPGWMSPKLLALYEAAKTGDVAAVTALECYRLEALEPRDHLDATLLLFQVEADRGRHQRAMELARQGLERAKQGTAVAEIAVFSAHVAYYRSLELIHREMEHEADLQMSAISGWPYETGAQAVAAAQALADERMAVSALLKDARTFAQESDNVLAVYIVMSRQASCATHRYWRWGLRGDMTPDARTADAIKTAKALMEQSYEAVVWAAKALGDDRYLAAAYGNYANDLEAFRDKDRARELARRALELAKGAGDSGQEGRMRELLSRLG